MTIDSPVSYDALGTNASPVTLTAAFSGNRWVGFTKYFKKVHLDITFTPGAGSTNQQALILIEASNEEGASGPTNFYTQAAITTGTTEIDLFSDSGYSMSTASGIPLVVPGDKTSTASTAITPFYDIDPWNSAYIRISARDSGSANFGTLHVRLTLQP